MEKIILFNDFLVLIIFAFIFGSVLGSFLNVCIYRLPREESIAFPPSHCTSCNTPIRFYHNVPLISYLILRGRCGNCNVRISPIYPVVEALTGAVCALLVWKFDLTLETLFYFIFLSALIVITFIDLEHKIIPNVITFPGIVIGLAYNAIRTDWSRMSGVFDYLHYDFWGAFTVLDNVPIIDSILGVIIGGRHTFSHRIFIRSCEKEKRYGNG
ncbi:MAG TPA: prepilin peptidase [Thermodesulfobacteriota bacterium]|nr:prepilin peptidase [Thermodesulfobacteriota bacterium]